MKYLLLLSFSFLAVISNAQEFEFNYFDQSITNGFQDIHFVSEQVGYIASNSGQVIKSIDGGENWTATNLDNDIIIYSIDFVDEDNGFAVGGRGFCSPPPCEPPGSLVFSTTDGGDSWTTIRLDNRVLYTVDFLNSEIGVAAGLGNLYRTIDTGKTWKSIDLGTFYNIKEVKFINGIGYASCLFGKMLKSTDEGETWQPLHTGQTSHFYAFDFFNEDIGYAGGQNIFIKTIDGGVTWEELPNAPTDIFSISSITSDYIFASGQGVYSGGDFGIYTGGIYFSTDGGDTWAVKDSLDISPIVRTSFYSENLGFGIGRHSKILKLTPKITSNTSNGKRLESKRMIFPNPTESMIYFTDFENVNGLRIKIMDTNGQILINEFTSKNEMNIEWMKKGVYFYQIDDGNSIVTGRLLKI